MLPLPIILKVPCAKTITTSIAEVPPHILSAPSKKTKAVKKEMSPIKTERFLLRAIIDSDIQNIYKGLSNPQVIKYYGVSFDSLEATAAQMKWYEEPGQYWWAICSIDNQEFYGAGGLNSLSTEHKKAEIGLWLLPDFWGNGIMTEVMPFICQYGFDELSLHRIEGFVESDNQNCKRAMAKLDFAYEGTMRDCEVKDGKHISVDIYAKLKNNKPSARYEVNE